MFSSTLFKSTQCPQGPSCSLLNCLFSHQPDASSLKVRPHRNVEEDSCHVNTKENEPLRKKRRLNIIDPETSTKATMVSKVQATTSVKSTAPATPAKPSANGASSLKSTKKKISPPPLGQARKSKALPVKETKRNVQQVSKSQQLKPEQLNPRMMQRPPATHAMRLVILSKLHQQMSRLNDEVSNSSDPHKDALVLSASELVTMALDEEEKIAKENPTVYSNVIKLRIVALKNMKLDDWKKVVLGKFATKGQQDDADTKDIVVTGLETELELQMLQKLLLPLDGLEKYGYVVSQPTASGVALARSGVETSQGFEQCDRCKTRFQVFPGRREDGALTGGGKCTYHPGKPVRPVKSERDKTQGQRDPYYPCCNETMGTSTGCTTTKTHVFKISDPNRLASILQFESTPEKPKKHAEQALCFDCEMGYTTLGMELIRLTVTSWPDGKEVIDVLVRPMGEVLDLNSQYSGIWPRHFANAVPYNGQTNGTSEVSPKVESGSNDERPMQLVDSPKAARELLFEYLDRQTPLIGHAIENDLNAVRIIHPSIIDTVLLYPHPGKLPYRYALKTLTRKYLGRSIQTAGVRGHDSKEDAKAAGDLVRVKVGEAWKDLHRKGWTIKNKKLVPPVGSEVEE